MSISNKINCLPWNKHLGNYKITLIKIWSQSYLKTYAPGQESKFSNSIEGSTQYYI